MAHRAILDAAPAVRAWSLLGTNPRGRSVYEFDASRIGKARRKAISVLDEYQCTTAELRAMFGVSKATFHRYADGVRLLRRPTEVKVPMSTADAREIATVALLRAGFTTTEIVEALHTSKSAVSRRRQAWLEHHHFSPAERRMQRRYRPSYPRYRYQSPAERRWEAGQRRKRWVTRSRGRFSD